MTEDNIRHENNFIALQLMGASNPRQQQLLENARLQGTLNNRRTFTQGGSGRKKY